MSIIGCTIFVVVLTTFATIIFVCVCVCVCMVLFFGGTVLYVCTEYI